MMAITPYKGREAQPIIEAALQRYEEGIEIEQSAKELGVPARTIHRWLATNATERWREAQQGRVQADHEAARKARDEASRVLNELKEQLEREGIKDPAERNWRLAHAREVLKAADTELDHQKWLLERLLRRIYGEDKSALLLANGLTVQVVSFTSDPAPKEEKVIEGSVVNP